MDYSEVIVRTGEVVDAAGVAVIVIGAVINAGAAAVRLVQHETGTYRRFRQQLGQTILLGLELLVAGDIIRTVASQPTLTSVAILASIVLVRTFLSFSLEVELTGHWPWQASTTGLPPPETTPRRPPRLLFGPRADQFPFEDARAARSDPARLAAWLEDMHWIGSQTVSIAS